jgi:hypothetical protein
MNTGKTLRGSLEKSLREKMAKALGGAAALALVLVAAQVLLAQGSGRSMTGGRFSDFRTGPPVTGAPYSATRTITHVQKLSDSTTIIHTTVIKEARDSSGRLYRETQPEAPGRSFTTYSVFDPVSRVSIHWTSNTKQASLMHLPDPSQIQSGHWARGPHPENRLAPEDAGQAPDINGGATPHLHGNRTPPQMESLGSKTIGGLVADGTRSTRMIPAGAEGNDQPITITHETWVSSDLKIELMRTESDPRFGATTVELSNLSRAEPPAALFQAPAGYAVQERTPGQRGPINNPAPGPVLDRPLP